MMSIPTLPESLRKAYEVTEYRVLVDPILVLRIGMKSNVAVTLLRANSAFNAVLVTAWNPFSRALSSAGNDERVRGLRTWVLDHQMASLAAEGVDPTGKWPAEASRLVFGVREELIDELLTVFEQHAVVVVSASGVPELVLHPSHRTYTRVGI